MSRIHEEYSEGQIRDYVNGIIHDLENVTANEGHDLVKDSILEQTKRLADIAVHNTKYRKRKIRVNNPFGQDPMDFNESTDADRIGYRIREIRESRNMTRAELGEKVGLDCNRVQQYENGARKPKSELLKQFANALGVSTLALTDPIVVNYFGAMYALFEMEKRYDLKVKRDGAFLSLVFGNGFMGKMNSYIDEWERECRQVDIELEAAISEEERASVLHAYEIWKWNFSKNVTDRTKRDLKQLRKAKLEELMKQLQKELSDLNDEDGD